MVSSKTCRSTQVSEYSGKISYWFISSLKYSVLGESKDEDKNQETPSPSSEVSLSVGLGLSIMLNIGAIILVGWIFLKKRVPNSFNNF